MAELQTPTAEAPSKGQLSTSQGRYRSMRLSRRFEETMHDQHGDGQVPGPLHLSIGQEAVAVGCCWRLRKTAAVLSTHRGHHHSLAKGAHDAGELVEHRLLGLADLLAADPEEPPSSPSVKTLSEACRPMRSSGLVRTIRPNE